MKSRITVLIIAVIALTVFLSTSTYAKTRILTLTGNTAMNTGHFEFAVTNFQKALKLDPDNGPVKQNLQQSQKAIAFKKYLEDVRPILFRLKSIYAAWDSINIRENLREEEDYRAADVITKKLLPEIDQLLTDVGKSRASAGFEDIESELIKSIKYSRQAYVLGAEMLNSLTYSATKNDEIQKNLSAAYFANKNYFGQLAAQAEKLKVSLRGFSDLGY